MASKRISSVYSFSKKYLLEKFNTECEQFALLYTKSFNFYFLKYCGSVCTWVYMKYVRAGIVCPKFISFNIKNTQDIDANGHDCTQIYYHTLKSHALIYGSRLSAPGTGSFCGCGI